MWEGGWAVVFVECSFVVVVWLVGWGVEQARDMLGGNGIVDEYHVIRHVLNLVSQP